jgi:ferritin-like metal-binding protein YciE
MPPALGHFFESCDTATARPWNSLRFCAGTWSDTPEFLIAGDPNGFSSEPNEPVIVDGFPNPAGYLTMAKKLKLLEDLFYDTLKDIYFAENKILKALPKMAKAAQSKDLKAAFTKHERETRGQVKRLESVFKIIGKPARGKTCAAINGIADEGAEIMKEYKGMPALDAGLLAAAQAVEHYEISRYGTLRTWAQELGLSDAARLLYETLKEEEATDKALTVLAKNAVNLEAEKELQAA